MARSHAVWVVATGNDQGGRPVAAFTVKHELASWLEMQTPESRVWLHVWRCENPAPRYNGHGPTPIPVEVPITDLLSAEIPVITVNVQSPAFR